MDFFSISERIERSMSPDFGDVLSKSIDLFKKVWLQGFLMMVFTFVLLLPVIIISYVPLFGVIMENAQYEASSYNTGDIYLQRSVNPFEQLSTVIYSMAIIFGGILAVSFLMYAVMAGFYRVLKNADIYGKVETSDLFYYFKGKYLGKAAVLGISVTLISLVATLLCYFPVIYVSVPLNMALVVFAFNPDLSVSDILKVSFKLGNKYWLIIFGLILVAGIISGLGVIACGIGMLFTASFARIPLYVIYKETVGFEVDLSQQPIERY